MEMRIRILKTTVAAKQTVRMGQLIDLDEAEANFLIGLNKAEPVGLHGESLLSVNDALVETKIVVPKKSGRKKKIT